MLIVFALILVFDNYCSNKNMEKYNNQTYNNCTEQEYVNLSNKIIDDKISKIVEKNDSIKKNINRIKYTDKLNSVLEYKIVQAYKTPDLPLCSYKAMNVFNNEQDNVFGLKNNELETNMEAITRVQI